jgi:hypothetical protein
MRQSHIGLMRNLSGDDRGNVAGREGILSKPIAVSQR